jgi:hypothetical protein
MSEPHAGEEPVAAQDLRGKAHTTKIVEKEKALRNIVFRKAF